MKSISTYINLVVCNRFSHHRTQFYSISLYPKRETMRWGICSAGLIATDFCNALQCLDPSQHKVSNPYLFFLLVLFIGLRPCQGTTQKSLVEEITLQYFIFLSLVLILSVSIVELRAYGCVNKRKSIVKQVVEDKYKHTYVGLISVFCPLKSFTRRPETMVKCTCS